MIFSSLMVDQICLNIVPSFFHLVDVVAIDAMIQQGKYALGDYMVALSRILEVLLVHQDLPLYLVKTSFKICDLFVLCVLRGFGSLGCPHNLLDCI